MGDTSHTLGTVLRLVTAALIALAALPVALTLVRTRRPEMATPEGGAPAAAVVGGGARAGRCLDRRAASPDLAEPRQGRPVALRGVRRRGGGGDPRHRGVLPVVRRRAAARAAEAAQGEEAPEAPWEDRRGLGRGDNRQRRGPAEAEGAAEESADETEADEPAAPAAEAKPAEKPAEPAAEAEPAVGTARCATSARPARPRAGSVAATGAASPPTNRSGVTDGSSLC